MKLNLGPGPHYADGWVNVDVTQSDEHNIHPDVLIEPGSDLPFADDTFDLAYLGHIIEHVPWRELPDFMAEIVRVVKPGGRIGIVGPDVMRAIQRWSEDQEPFWLVEATLEDDKAFMTEGQWDGARHQWNCYEARVDLLLDNIGLTNHKSLDLTQPAQFVDWPIVAYAPWQFAVEVQL